VSNRPLLDIRVALQATLQKLEKSLDAPEEASALTEIKRIILLRIAEIDAAETLKQVAENADTAILRTTVKR